MGREESKIAVTEIDRLLVSLGLAFRRAKAFVARESGVRAPRLFLLAMLERREGISQGEVWQRFELDPSRITRLAQTMESDGLIRRERDPDDNRVVRMYLTNEGRELLRVLPSVGERFRFVAGEVLSPEELGELRRMLDALAEAMEE